MNDFQCRGQHDWRILCCIYIIHISEIVPSLEEMSLPHPVIFPHGQWGLLLLAVSVLYMLNNFGPHIPQFLFDWNQICNTLLHISLSQNGGRRYQPLFHHLGPLPLEIWIQTLDYHRKSVGRLHLLSFQCSYRTQVATYFMIASSACSVVMPTVSERV